MKDIEVYIYSFLKFFVDYFKLIISAILPNLLARRVKKESEKNSRPFTYLSLSLFLSFRFWQYVFVISLVSYNKACKNQELVTQNNVNEVKLFDFVSLPSITEFLMVSLPLLLIVFFYTDLLEKIIEIFKIKLQVNIKKSIIYFSAIYYLFFTIFIALIIQKAMSESETDNMPSLWQFLVFSIIYLILFLLFTVKSSKRLKIKSIITMSVISLFTIFLLHTYIYATLPLYGQYSDTKERVINYLPEPLLKTRVVELDSLSSTTLKVKIALNYFHGAEGSLYINPESTINLIDNDSILIGKLNLIEKEIILSPGESKIISLNVVLDKKVNLKSTDNLVCFKVFNLKYYNYQDIVSGLNSKTSKANHSLDFEKNRLQFQYLDWDW